MMRRDPVRIKRVYFGILLFSENSREVWDEGSLIPPNVISIQQWTHNQY